MTALPRAAAVLGGGALGQVLVPALRAAGVHIALAWNRTEQRGWRTELEQLRDAELVLLTVSDPAVEPLCRQVAGLIAHCAGALTLDPLRSALEAGARTGSLHPLRAIPRGSAPGILRDAAAGIAGSDGIAREQLHQLARALGMSPIPVSAEARALYHAAAVLAAAGQVALFSRAVKAFQMATGAPEPIARAALLPLSQGALSSLERLTPDEALTGPVARGDAETVSAHRAALPGDLVRLYDELTRAALELKPSAAIEASLKTRPAAANPKAAPGSRSSPRRPPPPSAARPSASSRSPAPRARPPGRRPPGPAPRRKR